MSTAKNKQKTGLTIGSLPSQPLLMTLAFGAALSVQQHAVAQVDASNLVDIGADVAASIGVEDIDADAEAGVEVNAETGTNTASEQQAEARAEAENRVQIEAQAEAQTRTQAGTQAAARGESRTLRAVEVIPEAGAEGRANIEARVQMERAQMERARMEQERKERARVEQARTARVQAEAAAASQNARATTTVESGLSAMAESADGDALKIDLQELDESTKEQIRSGKNVVITGQFGAQDDGVTAASQAEVASDSAVPATVLPGASASGADLLLINGKQETRATVDTTADLTAAENAAVVRENAMSEAEAKQEASVRLGGEAGSEANAAVMSRVDGGVLRLKTLMPKKIQGGTVISGGIGESEEARMKALKSNYNLRLTFAAEGSGTYLADVLVNITADNAAEPIVNMVSTGPLFYADLPAGEYTVRATSRGKTNIYLVTLNGSASKDVILTWEATGS